MSSELFTRINSVVAGLPGWCSPEKAEALASMVLALKPTLAVEIGVFGGRSLQAIALAMQHVGRGRIIGIDPWSTHASLEGMADEANRAWWSHLDHEQIYQTCINGLSASTADRVTEIIRMKSDDVEPMEFIDLLHVDGSHEETAYRDTVRFGAKVRVGGLFVADDLDWSSGAPRRGAQWLLDNGFMQLYPLGTGAVFQRIK